MDVSEIYQKIAQNIVNAIEEDWSISILNIQASDNWAKTYGEYESSNINKKLNVHKFDDMLEFDLMELHEITTNKDHNRWNRAIFKLWPEGKFDMEFIWDQELHDEIDRLNK